MKLSETAEVLAAIQIYDGRNVDGPTIKAWHRQIGRFALRDCMAAVDDYYANETGWIMPAHIRRRVKSKRAHRLEIFGELELRKDDELTEEGDLAPDRAQKYRRLLDLVANGEIDRPGYELYRAGELALEDLKNTSPRELH